MLQALSTSTTTMPFVRVSWNEPWMLMKYLDAGAYGIIVPMIETKEDAQRVVWGGRYPPVGMRSFGPARAALYAGSDYAERANDTIVLAVMIETPKALENLEEIASVDGIDALFIGPNDLSQALGLGLPPNADHPKHDAAVTRIREVAAKHGKIAGIHSTGSAQTNRYIKEGFKMIVLTGDATGVGVNARSELAAVKETLAAANNGAAAPA
jgi:4-hydroxy-2-oxoheptanedioate aldolase